MPLNLLAIGRSDDLAGLAATPEGSAARWIVYHGLAAAVVSASAKTFEPLSHAAIVTAIHRQIDILPVRFGTILADDDAVRSFLDCREPVLVEALGRLRDTSEMGLRIELLPLPAAADRVIRTDAAHVAVSPAQYLARRRRQYQWQDCIGEQAQQAVEDCVRTLSGVYRDWRRLTAAPPGLVRLAFLVERSCLDAFRERLVRRPASPTAARCTLLGPWPPYSFV